MIHKKTPEEGPYQSSNSYKIPWLDNERKRREKGSNFWKRFREDCGENGFTSQNISEERTGLRACCLMAADLEPLVRIKSVSIKRGYFCILVKWQEFTEMPLMSTFLEELGFEGYYTETLYKNVNFQIAVEEIVKHLQ